MKTLTVRLPESLAAQIEAESLARKVSKAEVVRERLSRKTETRRHRPVALDAVADLIGSVKGLPTDLSTAKTKYLKTTGYGRKPHP